jgi:hypothetical protein
METVTISIETYEQMKAEIKRLKIENEEKTIYKQYLPDWALYPIVSFCFLAFFFMWATLFHF